MIGRLNPFGCILVSMGERGHYSSVKISETKGMIDYKNVKKRDYSGTSTQKVLIEGLHCSVE